MVPGAGGRPIFVTLRKIEGGHLIKLGWKSQVVHEADTAKVRGHEVSGVVITALIVLLVEFLGVVFAVVVTRISDRISTTIDNLIAFRIFVKVLTRSPAKRICRGFLTVAQATHVSGREFCVVVHSAVFNFQSFP